jgi:hypothetical protein
MLIFLGSHFCLLLFVFQVLPDCLCRMITFLGRLGISLFCFELDLPTVCKWKVPGSKLIGHQLCDDTTIGSHCFFVMQKLFHNFLGDRSFKTAAACWMNWL